MQASKPKRRVKNRPEQVLQKAVAEFLGVALPRDAVFFHVPNGGARNATEGGIFKAMGVKAGVPDLVLLWRSAAYAIELKADKTPLSDSQIAMHARLVLAQIPVAVCRSLDEVERQLTGWGFPLRAKIGPWILRKVALREETPGKGETRIPKYQMVLT